MPQPNYFKVVLFVRFVVANIVVSSMKGSLLEHWVPGAGANFCYFFSIQAKLGFPGKAPVCSALITQVNINSINYINQPLINNIN